MKVYGIGGLGVDKRVFSELTLDFELICLEWIEARPKETMQAYAHRFATQIDSTHPFSIIGISFGGMMAIELNKILKPQHLILISSASSKYDIPWLYRMLGKVGLFSLVPDFMMKPPALLANFFFGVSEPKYKKLLKEILADTDHDFLRWASHQIARWDHTKVSANMSRIHGSADRLLGFSDKEEISIVPKAGHFMVMNRAREISDFLNREIAKHQK